MVTSPGDFGEVQNKGVFYRNFLKQVRGKFSYFTPERKEYNIVFFFYAAKQQDDRNTKEF